MVMEVLVVMVKVAMIGEGWLLSDEAVCCGESDCYGDFFK